MIVIGADTHKSTHTLAAVDAATGRVVAANDGRRQARGDASPRGGGRGVWIASECGRSRTAGTCPGGWSGV